MTALAFDDIADISIHAPVKGATHCIRHHHPENAISIHAPVKGATSQDMVYVTIIFNFNPRSREGSDLMPLVASLAC